MTGLAINLSQPDARPWGDTHGGWENRQSFDHAAVATILSAFDQALQTTWSYTLLRRWDTVSTCGCSNWALLSFCAESGRQLP